MTDEQLTQIKTALLSALQDAGEVGPEADQTHEQITKFAVLSALKDAGLITHIQAAGQAANAAPAKESIEINYKDAPEDIKRQMEAEAGFSPSETLSPAATDQIVKHKQLQQAEVQGARDHAIKSAQVQISAQKPKKEGGQNG